MEWLRCLIARAGGHTCAIPLATEMELMRPLGVEPLPGVPPFVSGMTVVRGGPAPVIDLGRLLEDAPRDAVPRRWVFSKIEGQPLVLAVESVDGVAELDRTRLEAAPTFGSRTDGGIVSAIALHDRRLLWVLQSTRLVPPEVWQTVREHVEAGRA